MKTTLFARLTDGVGVKQALIWMLGGLFALGIACTAFVLWGLWTAIQVAQ